MRRRRTPHLARGGFTLVELTLTMVVGSLVLVGVLGIFSATRSMERVFSARFEHSTDLAITQGTIRRAMLSLHVQSDAEAPSEDTNNEGVEAVGAPERPRMILGDSPLVSGADWTPQRFELVVSAPPIALDTMSSAGMWARAEDQEDTLDFSGPGGSTMRSAFELRRDGTREALMRRAGILPDDGPLSEGTDPERDDRGWTLWWRPIPESESRWLRDGNAPRPDDAGGVETIRERFSGAVRLAEGIEACRWQVFFGDEKITQYTGTYQRDIPAYMEFEILLTNGQFATWMFEVDWTIGDDPLVAQDEAAGGGDGGGEDDGDGDGEDGPGGGPGGGDPQRGTGGLRGDPPDRTGQMGGGDT